MPENRTVKIGSFYWLRARFRSYRTGQIIKISKIGSAFPQQIDGEVFDTRTGELSVTKGIALYNESHQSVFACEIEEEVSQEEMMKIKVQFLDRMISFFTPANNTTDKA